MGAKSCEYLGVCHTSELFRDPLVWGMAGHLSPNKEQLIASHNFHHKEENKMPGKPRGARGAANSIFIKINQFNEWHKKTDSL